MLTTPRTMRICTQQKKERLITRLSIVATLTVFLASAWLNAH
jgi:hypothetical protein